MFDGKGLVPVYVMEDIAKAIRSKMKEQNLYKPTEMAAAIRSMTPYFYDTTGTFYILSPDYWTIHVTQSEHQTISYSASGEAVQKGVDKWSSRLFINSRIVANAGFTPGTIHKTIDSTNHDIVLMAEPATPIADMVKDGVILAYMKHDDNTLYSKMYMKRDEVTKKDVLTFEDPIDVSNVDIPIRIVGSDSPDFTSTICPIQSQAAYKNVKGFDSNYILTWKPYSLYGSFLGDNIVGSAGWKMEYFRMPNLTHFESRSELIRNIKTLKSVNFENLEFINSELYASEKRVISVCTGCTSLTDINFTQLKVAYCDLLTGCAAERIGLPNLEIVQSLTNFPNLIDISLPALVQVFGNLLCDCPKLTKVALPALEKVDGGFLDNVPLIEEIECPKVYELGTDFLNSNRANLRTIKFPELITVKGNFVCKQQSSNFTDASFPKLQSVTGNAFCEDSTLQKIDVPELQTAGGYLLCKNKEIKSASFPELKTVGGYFCSSIFDWWESDKRCPLKTITAPKLEKTGPALYFKGVDVALESIDLPSLKNVDGSLASVDEGTLSIKSFNTPSLETVSGDLLLTVTQNKTLSFPQLKTVGRQLMGRNSQPNLASLELPNLESVGGICVCNQLSPSLKKLSFPKLKTVGDDFAERNTYLEEIEIPLLESANNSVCCHEPHMKKFIAPSLKTVKGYLLNDMSGLLYVDLGALVNVGQELLTAAPSLKTLIIRSNVVPTVSGAMCNTKPSDCILYVPDDMISQYLANSKWSAAFDKDHIKPISEAPQPPV